MAPEGVRRILVLGASGQVGYELSRALGGLGVVTALGRAAADFNDPDLLRAVVRRARPDVIVNAAAYTAVDHAERHPDVAHRVNSVAPGVLAEEAAAGGACLVHYSTDYVFDGRKRDAYVETDATGPLSVYGRTKLLGEEAVQRVLRRHVVLRTSWVLGVHGTNFLKTILRLAAERASLRVVADQVGAPTPASLIAAVTARVVETMARAADTDPRWGVYHLSSAGETSWYGYAQYAIGQARRLGIPLLATPESVTPISTAEYRVAAARPANSRLDTSKLRSVFAVELPDWTCGIDRVLHVLRTQETR